MERRLVIQRLPRFDCETGERNEKQMDLIHRLMDAESDALERAQAQFHAWWTHDWAIELRRRFERVLETSPSEESRSSS